MSSFSGSGDSKDCLEWEMRCDKIFNSHNFRRMSSNSNKWDSDGCVGSKSVYFKPTTPSRDRKTVHVDHNAALEGRSNHYSSSCVKHLPKPLHDSSIKRRTSFEKKKKELPQINLKPRMALFQGREDNVGKKKLICFVGVLPVVVHQSMEHGQTSRTVEQNPVKSKPWRLSIFVSVNLFLLS
uniref:Uncharacterized protein n=1 Tax=Oryza barthii TaxID=65489 RepID=A0A0D3FS97_9ORYZ